MTLEQLGNLGEFVAAVAFLFSLVYVGFQIKQNTAEIKQAAFRDIFLSYSRLRSSVYSDPTLSSLLIKAISNSANISSEEKLRLEQYYTEQVWCLVQLRELSLAGQLEYSETQWVATKEAILGDLDSNSFREYWKKWKRIYPDSIVGEIDAAF